MVCKLCLCVSVVNSQPDLTQRTGNLSLSRPEPALEEGGGLEDVEFELTREPRAFVERELEADDGADGVGPAADERGQRAKWVAQGDGHQLARQVVGRRGPLPLPEHFREEPRGRARLAQGLGQVFARRAEQAAREVEDTA